jgi:hypothetical protein
MDVSEEQRPRSLSVPNYDVNGLLAGSYGRVAAKQRMMPKSNMRRHLQEGGKACSSAMSGVLAAALSEI